MKICHIAFWTNDLERMKSFYEAYFDGTTGSKYVNEKKGFASYFIQFEGETTFEIMQRNDITEENLQECIGLTHVAFSVGSEEKVNQLTERLRQGGYTILGEPRTTGDGFYESVIADPDGNRIEIVA